MTSCPLDFFKSVLSSSLTEVRFFPDKADTVKALLRGRGYVHLSMSLVWFSKAVILPTEEEATSLSVLYYCICDTPHRFHSFEPTSCCVSPIHLSYVTVSRPCHLSEFNPNRVSLWINYQAVWAAHVYNKRLTKMHVSMEWMTQPLKQADVSNDWWPNCLNGLMFPTKLKMGKKVVQLPDKQLVNEKPFENQKPFMYVLAREVKFSNI